MTVKLWLLRSGSEVDVVKVSVPRSRPNTMKGLEVALEGRVIKISVFCTQLLNNEWWSLSLIKSPYLRRSDELGMPYLERFSTPYPRLSNAPRSSKE